LIEGTFVMAQSGEAANPFLSETPVRVRGTLAQPPKLVGEIENALVAGQPLVLHARFEGGGKGSVRAVVRSPGALTDNELTLVDSGSAGDGDAKADDGIYSAVFKKSEQLGQYQITFLADNPNGVPQKAVLTAPIYFKAPGAPLTGTITQRKKDDFIELKSAITSDLSTDIAVSVENSATKVPMETYLSSKSLRPGSNNLDLLVRLLPEAQAGEYKYEISLVTDPIAGTKARIPVSLQVKVTSFFQYFVRLVALALGLAFAVFLVVMRPWRRRAPSDQSAEFPSPIHHESSDLR
jgi:hypothetical protein